MVNGSGAEEEEKQGQQLLRPRDTDGCVFYCSPMTKTERVWADHGEGLNLWINERHYKLTLTPSQKTLLQFFYDAHEFSVGELFELSVLPFRQFITALKTLTDPRVGLLLRKVDPLVPFTSA